MHQQDSLPPEAGDEVVRVVTEHLAKMAYEELWRQLSAIAKKFNVAPILVWDKADTVFTVEYFMAREQQELQAQMRRAYAAIPSIN